MKISAELDGFLIGLGANGMSSEGLSTIESCMRPCRNKGVEIVLVPSLQGAHEACNPESNILAIGEPALSDNIQLPIETLEHEFIHVLQDEIDGLGVCCPQAPAQPSQRHAGALNHGCAPAAALSAVDVRL